MKIPAQSAQPGPRARPIRSPRLLPEWEPAPQVFWTNLRDLFRPPPPLLKLTSRPAPFWPDVFVNTRLPRRGLAPSVLGHLVGLVLLAAFPGFWFRINPPLERPAEERSITYYEVSEYLPPLQSPGASGRVQRKPDPAPAAQPIVSLPPQPDNFRQTIVNPEAPQLLRRDVPLPNIVAWTPVAAPVPVAASARSTAQLTMPVLPVEAVAPRARDLPRDVAQLRLPAMPEPTVVAPAVSADALRRNVGDLNIAHLETTVEAPRLPVAEQVAAAEGVDSPGIESPQVIGGEASTPGAGRLIALGLDPIAAAGIPIRLPQGSRQGQFAAGPEGRPGASGAPGSAGGGTAEAGTGSGGTAGPGSGADDLPLGIFVGGPGTPGGGAVVGGLPAPPPRTVQLAPPPRPAPATSQPLMASARRPSLADLARQTAPGSTPETLSPSPATAVEDEVFGPKKFYSMTLNMPNLTSASGSWIVRFAELHETPGQGDVTAPVAMNKVDPAYPTELIRARVEGVVVLYAVIGRDGTVSEVRVLRGLDARLDENARRALARWRFRPATKNGAAVDLEAVVQIPFVARRLPTF